MPFFQRRRPADKVIGKSEQKPRENRRLIIGGLAAFSGACVVQLLGLSQRDISLSVALFSFALSLPLLIRDLLDVQAEEHHEITINLEARLIATITGITGSIFGIGAIFWHFSPWICMVFILSCFWSAQTHLSYVDSLSEEPKPNKLGANKLEKHSSEKNRGEETNEQKTAS